MLTTEQEALLLWYDGLSEIERIAVDQWLLTGNPDSILALRETSERLIGFRYVAFFRSPEQLPLHG